LIVGLSSAIGTYPSGHATDGIRVSTSGAAESLRDPARTYQERIYINLICPESMVEPMKKSESEDESEIKEIIEEYEMVIKRLTERIVALEKAMIHAQHTNTDDGSRHQNDGGWFD